MWGNPVTICVLIIEFLSVKIEYVFWHTILTYMLLQFRNFNLNGMQIIISNFHLNVGFEFEHPCKLCWIIRDTRNRPNTRWFRSTDDDVILWTNTPLSSQGGHQPKILLPSARKSVHLQPMLHWTLLMIIKWNRPYVMYRQESCVIPTRLVVTLSISSDSGFLGEMRTQTMSRCHSPTGDIFCKASFSQNATTLCEINSGTPFTTPFAGRRVPRKPIENSHTY